ncbi:MAG TPA: hypothetical protein VEC36_02230 [Patescibacteria group bacterium]|nr:hypothetical protein [Patescibacteria group bacterium]
MKKTRFYRLCIISFCLITISSCSYFICYELISKSSFDTIEISNVNGIGPPDSTGNYFYEVFIGTLSDSLLSQINPAASYAVLTVDNQQFRSDIEVYNKKNANATFYGFPRNFDPLKKYPHFIELHSKSGDSIDYYYKFKNKN